MSPRRWDFISDNRADFGVKRICRVLGVSRAGFYRHLATGQARTSNRQDLWGPLDGCPDDGGCDRRDLTGCDSCWPMQWLPLR